LTRKKHITSKKNDCDNGSVGFVEEKGGVGSEEILIELSHSLIAAALPLTYVESQTLLLKLEKLINHVAEKVFGSQQVILWVSELCKQDGTFSRVLHINISSIRQIFPLLTLSFSWIRKGWLAISSKLQAIG